MVLKALYPASDTTDLQCPIPQILSERYDSAAEVAGSSTRGGRVPADLRRSPPNIACVCAPISRAPDGRNVHGTEDGGSGTLDLFPKMQQFLFPV